LDLPGRHVIPVSWLLEHGSEPIRYRTLAELAPRDRVAPGSLESLAEALVASKAVSAVVKKQRDDGVWGDNFTALAPSKTLGLKDVGTVPQYRRLLQLGVPRTQRAFRLAERVFFRVLSRDEDPALWFEYQKLVKGTPEAAPWTREQLREAATAALGESGFEEDPRLRGAAHKIANAVSQFLRGDLAAKPFVRVGGQTVLHPEAHPPSWYSVAMVAAMPSLRRERAGFTERLGHYLAQPAPKKEYSLLLGKKAVKPQHLLLGDPIDADAKGNAKDIPLALHYIELLAKMGALQWAPVASRVLARLVADCDESGVWRPKNLRTVPKALNRISYHMFPLHEASKTADDRVVDVTFRLALIARLLGWELQYV